MACILHIDSSTTVCSVAVSEDSKVIFEKQTLEGPSHATVLAPYVDEALSFIESHAIPLDAVAISSGPGSYTGNGWIAHPSILWEMVPRSAKRWLTIPTRAS